MKTKLKLAALLFSTSALALACSKSAEPPPPPAAPPPATPVATAIAPVPFEGEIVVAVKDEAAKKLPATITYDVKGSKVRYVPASGPVHAVGDLTAHIVYAVDDAQKTFDAIDVRAAMNAKAAPPPKVQKSGKIDKIAGLECENWTVDDGNEKVDVCAAKGIAYFDLASDAKPGSAETPWAVALTTEKAFPLRVVVHDKAGKEEYRAEATKADRRRIDDSVFQMPNGYKTADLAKEIRTASLP